MWVAGLYAHVVISINAHCAVVGSGQPGRREPSILRLVGDAELGEAWSTEKTCIWFRGLRDHRRWQSEGTSAKHYTTAENVGVFLDGIS